MKKFRFGGGFALAALFFASVFLGSCDDDYWEYPSKTKDSSLTVEINKTDNGDGTADITFIKSSSATGVIYTTDGNDPSVDYDSSEPGCLSYFGHKYLASAVKISADCTVKALAYKVDTSLETVKYGNVKSKDVDIEEVLTFQFLYENEILSSTAERSFRSGAFDYECDGVTYPDSKYKLLFKSLSGENYWELYVYHNGTYIPDVENNKNYIAKGIFSGTCISSDSITSGDVELKTLEGDSWQTVSLEVDGDNDLVFDLKISKTLIKKVTADY